MNRSSAAGTNVPAKTELGVTALKSGMSRICHSEESEGSVYLMNTMKENPIRSTAYRSSKKKMNLPLPSWKSTIQ